MEFVSVGTLSYAPTGTERATYAPGERVKIDDKREAARLLHLGAIVSPEDYERRRPRGSIQS